MRAGLRLVRAARVDARRRPGDDRARRLKQFKDTLKYMRPGNFLFLLYLLCDFRNQLKMAEAKFKAAGSGKKRPRTAD